MKTYSKPKLNIDLISPDTAISSGGIAQPCNACEVAGSGYIYGGSKIAPSYDWTVGMYFTIGNQYFNCTKY